VSVTYLKVRLKVITPGVVNPEVIVELPSGVEIASIITKNSVDNLQLASGKEVCAIIKASNDIIATG